MTHLAGVLLADTLYRAEAILLTGAVGAGKTTFLQGLGEGLGLPESVVSPTFALAHPHRDGGGRTRVTHIDLYRLSPADAETFVRQLQWEGMLWVEWSDRIDRSLLPSRAISVHLEDDGQGRRLAIDFDDAPLPSPAQIDEWRRRFRTPENVVRHCEAVGRVAAYTAASLQARGVVVRPELAAIGGRLHDLLRFLDFRSWDEFDRDTTKVWQSVRERFPGLRHEAAVADFLIDEGYPELGEAVRAHGLLGEDTPHTIEQRIIFYADKRAIDDRLVTVRDRFDDFDRRYGPAKEAEAWIRQTGQVEASLFPDGPPSVSDLTTPTA